LRGGSQILVACEPNSQATQNELQCHEGYLGMLTYVITFANVCIPQKSAVVAVI
jgi:hypothetical protein